MPKVPAAPTLFKTHEASGLAAALAQAKDFQGGTQYDAGSSELSRLADQLLAVGKAADGLVLAKTVAADAPRSESAAALLARAHRANGNRIEAVQNYSRAIELSQTPRAFPIYTDAIRQLSALEVKDQK